MANLESTQLKDGFQTLVSIGTTTVGNHPSNPLLGALTNGKGNALTQVTLGLGSASAPSYSFTGDTDTGMFSSGANALNLATGGNNRMTIASGGNISIGTANSSAKLQVGTSSEEILRLERDTTTNNSFIDLTYASGHNNDSDANHEYSKIRTKVVANLQHQEAGELHFQTIGGGTGASSPSALSTALVIDSSGNVGINETNPASLGGGAKLSVNQAVDGNIVFARGGSTRQVQLGTTSTTGYINADNTSGGFTFNVNASEKVRINSSGAVGINNSSPDSFATSVSTSSSLVIGQGASGVSPGLTLWQGNSAQATINFASANTGAGQYEGRIRYTRDTGVMDFRTNGLDNVLVLNASGKVGIGTNSPDAFTKLTVAGAMTLTGQNTGHGASRIKIGQDTTAISQIRFYGADASTAGILQFIGSSSDGAVGGERLRIDSSGNVGIGTTNPDEPIHVAKSTGDAIIAVEANDGNAALYLTSAGSGKDNRIVSGNAKDLKFEAQAAGSGQGQGQDPSATGTTIMTLTNSGNLGIGVSPSSKLQVAGTIDVNTASSGLPTIKLSHTNTGADNFEIKAGTTGVANSGFSIRDVDASENRLVIDSSGNVLVGKNASSLTTVGIELKSDGNLIATRAGVVTSLNREDSDGTIVDLRKDGTTVGFIGSTSSVVSHIVLDPRGGAKGAGIMGASIDANTGIIQPTDKTGAEADNVINLGGSGARWKDFYLGGTAYLQEKITVASANLKIGVDGSATSSINISSASLYPQTDGSMNLGFSASSFRFATVFATTGTINTSDEKQKQDIEELNEAELRVAQKAKTLMRKYRMISSVEEKGDDARIHVGIIAQDLEKAFADEGLDAGRYGMFIKETTINDDGEEQTAYAIRYNELLAFIISTI